MKRLSLLSASAGILSVGAIIYFHIGGGIPPKAVFHDFVAPSPRKLSAKGKQGQGRSKTRLRSSDSAVAVYKTVPRSLYLSGIFDQPEPTSRRNTPALEPHHHSLCGSSARKGAQLYPHFYPSTRALGPDSRVIVTGALGGLGMDLVTTLFEECGVRHILPIDALVPNVRQTRMRMMDRYSFLRRTVPTMEKLVVPFVGIESQTPSDQTRLEQFRPTHFVHLAPIEPTGSPNPHLGRRERETAMEQILTYLVGLEPRPAFVYLPVDDVEDVLVTTYARMHGLSAVSLRLPTVYGPWMDDENWLQIASRNIFLGYNESSPLSLSKQDHKKRRAKSQLSSSPTEADTPVLHVQDGTEVILAAMQTQRHLSKYNAFPPKPIRASSLEKVLWEIVGDSAKKPVKEQSRSNKLVVPELGWKPDTDPRNGVIDVLSWQLNRMFPFDKQNHTLPGLSFEDVHRYGTKLPCASECADRTNCLPGVFDAVARRSRLETKGCKFVLYVSYLDPTMDNLSFLPPYPDNSTDLCAIAFIASTSPIAKKKAEVTGWKLINVKTDRVIGEPLLHSLLPKISPGRLFSGTVQRVIYCDASVLLVPPFTAATTLLKRLHGSRQKSSKNTAIQSVIAFQRFLKTHRRVMLFSQLYDFSLLSDKYAVPPGSPMPHIPVSEVVRMMLMGFGKEPTESVRRQFQFYEHAAHLVQTSSRRPYREISSPQFSRFPFRWARTTLMVHDLKESTARQLRCEWYNEQADWMNLHMEDLSLGYILARRSIEGRLGNRVDGTKDDWYPVMKRARGHGLRDDNTIGVDDMLDLHDFENDDDGEKYVHAISSVAEQPTELYVRLVPGF